MSISTEQVNKESFVIADRAQMSVSLFLLLSQDQEQFEPHTPIRQRNSLVNENKVARGVRIKNKKVL